MKIVKILKKTMPVFVRQMKVSELDKNKCSKKFLSHNLNINIKL